MHICLTYAHEITFKNIVLTMHNTHLRQPLPHQFSLHLCSQACLLYIHGDDHGRAAGDKQEMMDTECMIQYALKLFYGLNIDDFFARIKHFQSYRYS